MSDNRKEGLPEAVQCPQCGVRRNQRHRGWCSGPPMMKLPVEPAESSAELPDDLREAYYTNNVVHAAVNQWRAGLMTRDEAFRWAIVELVKQGDQFKSDLLDLHRKGKISLAPILATHRP